VKVDIKWDGDIRFTATSGTGHSVKMDTVAEKGGTDQGPSPMELVLMGLGGCSAVDVVLILRKMKQSIENCFVSVDAERATTDPKVFTKIRLRFTVVGTGLSQDRVEHAVQLSADKYCSASAMLDKTAEITHEVEIVEAT
jgi:putative redox protein